MSAGERARTTTSQGLFVGRDAALPPATGASAGLFTVTGLVLVTSLWGHITVATPNEVLSLDLALDPDDGASDVALASAGSIQNKAAGTWIYLNTTVAGALLTRFHVGTNLALQLPHAMDGGTIKVNTTGGGAIGATARIMWGLTYLPLGAGGLVAAA